MMLLCKDIVDYSRGSFFCLLTNVNCKKSIVVGYNQKLFACLLHYDNASVEFLICVFYFILICLMQILHESLNCYNK